MKSIGKFFVNFVERLRCSLFEPSKIMSFREDKKSFTLIYFLFLIFIYILPSVLIVSLTYGLSFEMKEEIKDAFVYSDEVPYIIIDGEMKYAYSYNTGNPSDTSSRDNSEKDYYKVEFGNYIVYFSTLDDINNLKDESASGLDVIEKQIILFYKDGIYQYTPISISKLLSYENEAFEGLDFREAKVEDEGFWKQVFGLINDLLAYNKSSHITRVIISLIFQGFLSIGLFSACITFFLRMSVNNRISYSKHFQMMIYIMTPFVLLSAISSLFNILLIYYVGVFITIINSFRTGQLPYGGGKNNEL